MEPMTLDLAPQAAEVAPVVAGGRDDQLGDPTPCAGTPVARLLDHLGGFTDAFRPAAEKQPPGGAPRASPRTCRTTGGSACRTSWTRSWRPGSTRRRGRGWPRRVA